jgi:hypothetical protein
MLSAWETWVTVHQPVEPALIRVSHALDFRDNVLSPSQSSGDVNV